MGILLWIVLGGLAGWIASVIMKGGGQGVLGDILLGVLGAVVGGLIMNMFGSSGVNGFNVYSLVVAIIGAVALIGLSRLVYR